MCTEIEELLDDMDKISLPESAEAYKSFLPSMDVSCIKTSGKAFLNQAGSPLPVSGFFDTIAKGCSRNNVALTGGYNSTSKDLELNIKIDAGTTRSAIEVIKALESILRK